MPIVFFVVCGGGGGGQTAYSVSNDASAQISFSFR